MAGQETRQVLSGHLPAVVRGLKPVGSLPNETMLDLILGLPHRQPSKLTEFIKEVCNPESPRFRQFLTPAEFTLLFAPSEADYQAVIAFARSQQFEVVASVQNRTLLHVRCSAAAIAKAFQTTLCIYHHPKSQRTFFAPDVDPSIEHGLPILHITGLDDATELGSGPLESGSAPMPSAGSGGNGSLTAVDLRAAYAPGVSLTGAGQTVGILSFGAYNEGDINLYAAKNGMSPVPIQNIDLPGFNAGDPGADTLTNVEATLDIEMAIAMAPGLAKVVVYRAPHSSIPMLLNEMANPTMGEPFPLQLTTSYAINYGANSSNEQIFRQMAAQGQSFFVASGDNGAYFPVTRSGDFPPADSEYVTCVGGTILFTTGPAGAWMSEVA